MKKRFYTVLITILMVLSFESYAGIYGKIAGTVKDKDGKPVVGAMVRLPEIGKGAYVKSTGKYKIINIETGTYKMIISAISYSPDTLMVRVSADNTTEKNIVLGDDAVMLGEIVVTADKMISKRTVGIETKFGENEIATASTNDVNDIPTYTAGVATSGSGYTIRGSRDNQTQVKVDGMDVGDQFSGGFGSLGRELFPMVSSETTEEVTVKTGGFGAEHGAAMGGIVNTVVKTGRTDRYEAFVRYTGEIQPLWGSQSENINILPEGSRLGVKNTGSKGYDAAGQGQQQIEFGFSGPIPFLDKSTFNISGNNKFYEYLGSSYNINDPMGNNIGQLPDNSAWVKNITGRMKFAFTDELAVTIGGMWGLTNLEMASWGWLYADRKQAFPILNIDGIPQKDSVGQIQYRTTDILERQIKQNVLDVLIYNAFARINHSINDDSFYEINFKYNVNNNTNARRTNMDDPGYFSGYKVVEPVDNYSFESERNVLGPNQQNDYYERGDEELRRSLDNKAYISMPLRNYSSGFYESSLYRTSASNAYGLRNYLVDGGSSAYDFQFGSYWQIDGNYNLEIDIADAEHSIKTGFEFRDNTIARHYNQRPWESGATYADVYSDKWGNPYVGDDDINAGVVREITAQNKGSITAAFYAQDQINYKGIVLTPGIRVDYFDTRSKYREYDNRGEQEFDRIILLSEFYNGSDAGNYFVDATKKITFSPRINVKYPISENMNMSLNYGVYYKMPDLRRVYDWFNLSSNIIPGGVAIGDPNVRPERSNAFEVGFEWQITEDYAFNVQSYYKDIYNELGLVRVVTAPDPYDQVATTEYGLNKGIEFGLRKAHKDNTFFTFNYTLANITGTANSFQSNSNVVQDRNIVDRLDAVYTYPLSAFDLNRDVRHRVNFLLQLFYGKDEGMSFGNFYLLENSSAGVTVRYRSGLPYTRTSSGGVNLGERNAERHPGLFNIDLRLAKTIHFSDLFGDAMSNSSIEFSIWATNLFDFTDAVRYYSNSSDPDKNQGALDTQIGNFQATTYYKDADLQNPESIAPAQYDRYGERYYSKYADSDNNGLVTQLEMYESFQRYYQDVIRLRANYQYPRQVYFGIKINF